jgi:hypothetical protein
MTAQALERWRVLELARQVDEAVDPLWAAGKVALVLRLLLEDCSRLVGAQAGAAVALAPELACLDELCRGAVAVGTPELERELSPAHYQLLAGLASERGRYLRRLRRAQPGARWQLRLGVSALAITLSALIGGLWMRNTPTLRASGTYSTDFPVSQAIDGLTRTEWLLPEKQPGWLELAYPRPRALRTIRLRNSENSYFHDRATKSCRLQAFSRGRVVASVTAEFPPIEASRGWVTVPLVARDATELRIDVESFYGLGGGLAEVDVQ